MLILNYYYNYAIIWGIVLFLYSLGLSSINTILHWQVVLFLGLTVILSLFLSAGNKRKFNSSNLENMYHRSSYKSKTDIYVTGLLTIYFFLFEFYRFGNIPMLAYFTGNALYGDFRGIKTLYVFAFTFLCYYSIYLFYIYVYLQRKKRLLFESITLTIIAFLVGSRGTFFTNLFAMTLISMSRKKFSLRQICTSLLFCLALLYVFGIFGNLRSGYSWNDSSMISLVGGYYDTWPSYVPEAFKWAYSYITSPLNNLNYNYGCNINYDIMKCSEAFFPDFLAKRLFNNYSLSGDVKLVVDSLTVSTGFIKVCLGGGIIGMIFMYIGQFVILGGILKAVRVGAPQLYIPSLALANNIVCFFFFENTIAHSGFILPLLYPFFYAMMRIVIRLPRATAFPLLSKSGTTRA